MTIANQRIIFSLVKAGSIVEITTDQITFEYGCMAELKRDAETLQKAHYWNLTCKNHLLVAC